MGDRICVLVTGAGGDIGQSVIRCLRESGYNLKLLSCDIDPYAAGRKESDHFLKAPRVRDREEYLKFMKDAIKGYGIKYIYPIPELEIEFFDQNREYFDKIGVIVLINNPFIVNTFLNKYKTINFLRENGLPHPASYLIEDYDNELDYPLLIKAQKGWGGKSLIKVNNAEELQFYKGRITNAIVQEVIGTEDEEYTVGVFSNSTEIYSICFRRYLGYGSLSKFVQLVHSDEVKSIVEKIAGISQLDGCINVQLRKNENGYVPFEINPRISSTVYFRHYFGFQDVKWWLDSKEGKPIDYKLKYKKGIGVRTVGEVFFELE